MSLGYNINLNLNDILHGDASEAPSEVAACYLKFILAEIPRTKNHGKMLVEILGGTDEAEKYIEHTIINTARLYKRMLCIFFFSIAYVYSTYAHQLLSTLCLF